MKPPVLTLGEDAPEDETRNLVRGTVEEAASGILDAQADEPASAGRHERTDERQAHGSGRHGRGPPALAGRMGAGVPGPGGAPRRRGGRAPREARGLGRGGAHGDVPARRVGAERRGRRWDPLGRGDLRRYGPRPRPGGVREGGRRGRRPLASERPHACVDGTYARGSRGGAHGGVAVPVAVGADPDGRRGVVGVEGATGSPGAPGASSRRSPGTAAPPGRGRPPATSPRGRSGPRPRPSPDAERRRRAARSCRDVLAKVPKRRRKAVAAQPEATRAQESPGASARKAKEVAGSPGTSGLADAARVVEEGRVETPAYARLPPEHWRRIRTNNGIERPSREARRRTRAVASFPDGRAATTLAAARREHMAEGNWGTKRYLDAGLLEGWDVRGSAES